MHPQSDFGKHQRLQKTPRDLPLGFFAFSLEFRINPSKIG